MRFDSRRFEAAWRRDAAGLAGKDGHPKGFPDALKNGKIGKAKIIPSRRAQSATAA
jgi:hypothetical protein